MIKNRKFLDFPFKFQKKIKIFKFFLKPKKLAIKANTEIEKNKIKKN